MVIGKIKVTGTRAYTIEALDIPQGIVGATVSFDFSEDWAGLTKNVVFIGAKDVEILDIQDSVNLPPEVVAAQNVIVKVGVVGVDANKKMVIPTMWADLGTVKPGAPVDMGYDPTLPIWAQLLGMIGDLRNLNTVDKSSLVAAVNEVMSNSGGGNGAGAGGYYTPVVTQPTANTMKISFVPSVATMPAVEPVTITLPGSDSGQNPGQDGEDGATFTPAVSADGTLSWTNDKGLENPAPVNIKGPQGERGLTGETGPQGEKGQKGDTGAPGADGAKGDKGDKGDTGATGPKGDTGPAGADGKTAYQYAQDGGYTGTEEEFAALMAGNLMEPADDDMPKVFLTGDEFSDMTAEKNEVNMELDYVSETDTYHAYILIKWQGGTSINFAKKNFTVKMFADEARGTKLKKVFRDWGVAKHKYVLKANWIDHTHARNIVCANLWNEVVASRSDYDTLPAELRNSPKNGAIDGFPVKLYVNGTYQGVYTWNIGKDDWQWGMDEDNTDHALLCVTHNTNGVFKDRAYNFRALWSGVDEEAFEIEVGTNSDALKNGVNAMLSCIINNNGAAFKNSIGQYLDIQSAIDYYIHQYIICGLDGLAKNMLLGSYNLAKWYIGAYDMDAVFGLWYDGTKFVPANYKCPEDYQEKFNLLFERLEENFWPEIQARYAELRKSVYSFANMCSRFERFTDKIGTELFAEDLEVFPGIPQGSTNNIKQLRNYIRDRLAYCDEQISNGIPGTGVTLNKSSLTVADNASATLTATVIPNNTTDEVYWWSDNTAIATVNNGGITPVAVGKCIIYAKCGSGYAPCVLTVVEAVVDPTTYSVTNKLTNCTTSNSATTATENTAYTASITANKGYALKSVKVTMGGTDITSTAYSNGAVSIAAVTGAIVITAVAEAVPAYTNQVPISIDSSGATYNGTGYKDGYRLSSSGSEKEGEYNTVTGYIPAKGGDTIRIKGYKWYDTTMSLNYLNAYKSDFGFLYAACAKGGYDTDSLIETMSYDDTTGISTVKLKSVADMAYIRVCVWDGTYAKGENLIVTVNEEIV